MRLRIKFWLRWMMSAMSARPARLLGGMVQKNFSWQALGAALLGILLAKWTWLMLAPASSAMPPAAWEASDDAGRLFGTARMADAPAFAPLGDIKLIGVFAHRTRGFAVMQVEGKQIGVGLGDEIKPGVRLVETLADHVMIEQAGVRQRVDLAGAAAPAAPAATALVPDNAGTTTLSIAQPSRSATSSGPPALPGQIEALQQKLDAANTMPPERREALQHKLDRMRGKP